MTDKNDTDDGFEEPPTTFIGILEKSLEGVEGFLDEIHEGIEQADEDHPLDPADPIERIRDRLEDADGDAVVIDVEKELETLREAAGLSRQDVEEKAATSHEDAEDDPPAYPEARGKPLLSVIGDGPRQRILATFIGKHYTELGTGDVEQLTGISHSEVYDHLHALEDLGLLEAKRVAGGAPTWTFNTDHPVARKLGQLDDVCFREWHADDG